MTMTEDWGFTPTAAYPLPTTRDELIPLAREILRQLGVIDTFLDAAITKCQRTEGKPGNWGDYFRVDMCEACKAKVEGMVFPSRMCNIRVSGESDEVFAAHGYYAKGWNACLDAIKNGATP